MRWLLALIVVLLLVWYLFPEPEPVPVEESFIADEVHTLRKAEGFEQQYLDAERARRERLEQEQGDD
ncbi:MAG: hypothetical protein GTN86_06775 [Xanthomonadales bacterium]|nr:hypothetical protein [Xanthomonadales bacterium]NIN60593.1 hypothetical protein [Xanthomonadales bacterium]NIN75945.1 hypothetical protein [Xanthomonadales bacterium]NIO15037.1 hypothetical protein [Xanthomonadales bacterium]NIP12986.1 hypothetical protein [Xanthomonadales bacterium]